MKMEIEHPTISLVIPAYNEEKYLGRTLDSVMRAKEAYRNSSLIEVIVVNNASTDNTESIGRQYGVRIVPEDKRCLAAVRNRGAMSASGQILGFLDADSLVTENVFNSIAETMSSGRYIGGGTMIRLERMSLGLFLTRCITVLSAKWLLKIMGGLIFTEMDTFKAVGGFDESLYCAEDSMFLMQLRKQGKRLGKKFRILEDDYVVTSTRSFDQFGDWYYIRNIPKILLNGGIRAFQRREFCWRFWYDPRR